MQVNIEGTTIVRPQKPPIDRHHILPLSHLDTDRNLLLYLRYLRVYSGDRHGRGEGDPFDVIVSALSAALIRYYPFAGTLRRRRSDGRLELHCDAGDGVPVITAVVNLPLSHVGYLNSEVDESFAELLVPDMDPDPDTNQTPPITLQITKFSCGGFVLGAAVHHALCDGVGASLFFNAMAESARGSSQGTVDPVWDRINFLGPRNPPRVEFPIGDFLSLDRDFFPYKGSRKRVVKEWLSVKEEWLDQLKGLLHKQSDINFTTFEALCGFIWRAKIKAGGIPGDEKVTFAYIMNMRKVVNPPLPAGYYGNGCVPIYVHLTAKEVVEQPIWQTAACIKKSKRNATSEYVRSFIDYQELHYGEGINGGRRVCGFTDWRHLGHSSIDFGWGGPVAVVPLSRHLLGSVEPCFLLPGEEGLIRVLVHLEEDVVDVFRQEMAKLGNGLPSAI